MTPERMITVPEAQALVVRMLQDCSALNRLAYEQPDRYRPEGLRADVESTVQLLARAEGRLEGIRDGELARSRRATCPRCGSAAPAAPHVGGATGLAAPQSPAAARDLLARMDLDCLAVMRLARSLPDPMVRAYLEEHLQLAWESLVSAQGILTCLQDQTLAVPGRESGRSATAAPAATRCAAPAHSCETRPAPAATGPTGMPSVSHSSAQPTAAAAQPATLNPNAT